MVCVCGCVLRLDLSIQWYRSNCSLFLFLCYQSLIISLYLQSKFKIFVFENNHSITIARRERRSSEHSACMCVMKGVHNKPGERSTPPAFFLHVIVVRCPLVLATMRQRRRRGRGPCCEASPDFRSNPYLLRGDLLLNLSCQRNLSQHFHRLYSNSRLKLIICMNRFGNS